MLHQVLMWSMQSGAQVEDDQEIVCKHPAFNGHNTFCYSLLGDKMIKYNLMRSYE